MPTQTCMYFVNLKTYTATPFLAFSHFIVQIFNNDGITYNIVYKNIKIDIPQEVKDALPNCNFVV